MHRIVPPQEVAIGFYTFQNALQAPDSIVTVLNQTMQCKLNMGRIQLLQGNSSLIVLTPIWKPVLLLDFLPGIFLMSIRQNEIFDVKFFGAFDFKDIWHPDFRIFTDIPYKRQLTSFPFRLITSPSVLRFTPHNYPWFVYYRMSITCLLFVYYLAKF